MASDSDSKGNLLVTDAMWDIAFTALDTIADAK